jgi:hypothetical protein
MNQSRDIFIGIYFIWAAVRRGSGPFGNLSQFYLRPKAILSDIIKGVIIMAIMALTKVQGEVRVRRGGSDWVKGFNGMSFPDTINVVISTGPDGKCAVVDNQGNLVTLDPNSLVCFYAIGDRAGKLKSVPEVVLDSSEISRGLAALRG